MKHITLEFKTSTDLEIARDFFYVNSIDGFGVKDKQTLYATIEKEMEYNYILHMLDLLTVECKIFIKKTQSILDNRS